MNFNNSRTTSGNWFRRLKRGFSGAYAFVLAVLSGCSPADIPPLVNNDYGVPFYLTAPFISEMGDDPDAKPPTPSTRVEYPVNPDWLAIKSSYQTSDYVYHIILEGETNSNLIDSGIPFGLNGVLTHEKKFPNEPKFFYKPLDVNYTTDYPLQELDNAALEDPLHPYPLYADINDRVLEEAISLGKLYDNSNYTAVTISALMPNYEKGKEIIVEEKNESLRLLTDSFINGNNRQNVNYDQSTVPLSGIKTYTVSPNWFLNDAAWPSSGYPVERGGVIWHYDEEMAVYPPSSGFPTFKFSNLPKWLDTSMESGPGGFSILLWDGANPKKASYTVSAGGEKKKFEVDWSSIKFNSVPLEYMAWYSAKSAKINEKSVYTKKIDSSKSYGIYTQFRCGTGNPTDAADALQRVELILGDGNKPDNFVAPSFYPANSSGNHGEKKVFFSLDNGVTPGKAVYFLKDGDGILGTPGDDDKTWVLRAEIADRIRLITGDSNNPDIEKGWSFEYEIVAYCDTYPNISGIGDGSPLTIELHIPVKVSKP